MTRQEWLDSLKPGDIVTVMNRTRLSCEFTTVEKVTPKKIVALGIYFSKEGGHGPGQYSARLETERYGLERVVCFISDRNMRATLTDDQLRRIVAILEEKAG